MGFRRSIIHKTQQQRGWEEGGGGDKEGWGVSINTFIAFVNFHMPDNFLGAYDYYLSKSESIDMKKSESFDGDDGKGDEMEFKDDNG